MKTLYIILAVLGATWASPHTNMGVFEAAAKLKEKIDEKNEAKLNLLAAKFHQKFGPIGKKLAADKKFIEDKLALKAQAISEKFSKFSVDGGRECKIVWEDEYKNHCESHPQQECETFEREQCWDEPENVCTTNTVKECKTDFKTECKQEFNRQCRQWQEDECTTINEKQCKTEFLKECSNVTEKQCKTEYKPVCTKHLEDVCVTKHDEECWDEPREECHTKNHEECWTEQKQKCHSAPECTSVVQKKCSTAYRKMCAKKAVEWVEAPMKKMKGKSEFNFKEKLMALKKDYLSNKFKLVKREVGDEPKPHLRAASADRMDKAWPEANKRQKRTVLDPFLAGGVLKLSKLNYIANKLGLLGLLGLIGLENIKPDEDADGTVNVADDPDDLSTRVLDDTDGFTSTDGFGDSDGSFSNFRRKRSADGTQRPVVQSNLKSINPVVSQFALMDPYSIAAMRQQVGLLTLFGAQGLRGKTVTDSGRPWPSSDDLSRVKEASDDLEKAGSEEASRMEKVNNAMPYNIQKSSLLGNLPVDFQHPLTLLGMVKLIQAHRISAQMDLMAHINQIYEKLAREAAAETQEQKAEAHLESNEPLERAKRSLLLHTKGKIIKGSLPVMALLTGNPLTALALLKHKKAHYISKKRGLLGLLGLLGLIGLKGNEDGVDNLDNVDGFQNDGVTYVDEPFDTFSPDGGNFVDNGFGDGATFSNDFPSNDGVIFVDDNRADGFDGSQQTFIRKKRDLSKLFGKKLFPTEDEDLNCKLIPDTHCIDAPVKKCFDKQHCEMVPVNECKQVPVNECHTKTERRCRSVPRQECKQVPRESCKKVPEEVCWNEPREVCKNVPTQKCWDEPRQSCRKVPREECKDVPQQKCVQVPETKCWDEPRESCRNEPRRQCKTVPEQKCKTVPKETCKTVAVKIPKKMCW